MSMYVLALVGLTETLVRGAYARAFCFAQDKTKYFCSGGLKHRITPGF